MPRVSVLMPVFNGDRFLKAAIDSVLAQTFSDFEFLIIDDGSTDNTGEILRTYSDVRIIILQNEENFGVARTLNKGILHAKGEYIARMDADDICLSERLEKQVDFLDRHPEVAVIDCSMEHIDEGGRYLHQLNSTVKSYREIRKKLPWENCLGHSSMMYRREIVKRYLYNQVVYEDLDLWLRLVNDNNKIERLEEPLLLYRIHAISVTGRSKINNTHFKNLVRTKRFYLKSLPLSDRFRFFNVLIFLAVMRDAATLIWKRLKGT